MTAAKWEHRREYAILAPTSTAAGPWAQVIHCTEEQARAWAADLRGAGHKATVATRIKSALRNGPDTIMHTVATEWEAER